MKSLIVAITILVWVGMIAGIGVLYAQTDTVAATVTVSQVSVSVTDGTVPYGTLSTSGTTDTTTLVDTQLVTNDGNVTEDMNVRGRNSTPDNWTLASSAGADQYRHEFATVTTGTLTALTTSNQTMSTNLAVSATHDLKLSIGVPTSTAATAQQTVDVTVQASAS